MIDELTSYAKEAASAKRKELVEDADNQPEARMSDYDRGWLCGYIAAMTTIRNEAERMQARAEAEWNSSAVYDAATYEVAYCRACSAPYAVIEAFDPTSRPCIYCQGPVVSAAEFYSWCCPHCGTFCDTRRHTECDCGWIIGTPHGYAVGPVQTAEALESFDSNGNPSDGAQGWYCESCTGTNPMPQDHFCCETPGCYGRLEVTGRFQY